MENKKQSSIDWLIDRIEDVDNTPSIWEQIKIIAREKHKQEIIDACDEFGNLNGVDILDYKEYYNQTFNQ
jgi:hypothetical protein